MRGEDWIIERQPAIVVPKMRRIVVMRDALAIVAEEAIEALFERIAGAAYRPEAPLAEPAQPIAELVQCERQLQFAGRHGLLSFRAGALLPNAAAVVAN